MILTPLNIQVAIIKAFYALAKKSVKYYTGLALGKNNTCLFKEIRLLRAYVEILRNFEIVGSTITCNCCVEGDFNVLLNSDLPVTDTPIQFGCDNQGYMVYNGIGYEFTYFYDDANKKIVIDFSGVLNDVVITITDVQFTDTCDITGNAVSPIEVATIDEITEPPVTVDNDFGTWDGNITIYESDGSTELVPPISLTIPAADMDNVEAILELWNTTYPEWILQYFEGQFVLYSPFDNVNYTDYIVKFKQYEGGTDATLDFDLSELPPFITENTPSYADILFEQPTFAASHVAETTIALSSGRLPYNVTADPASVTILIPIDQFAVGEPATMSIPLYELFNSTNQDFYYLGMPMFSHSGTYTGMPQLIDDFNVNNGQGFTASYGGIQPISETLATASNISTLFNIAVPTDVYTARLFNQSLSINLTIGTYTVGGDDVPEDIANFIAADIIAQDIFEGTVSVSGTVITLTAPTGTGASWNTVYSFTIQRNATRINTYVFSGGVGVPTTPIYLLNITALNIYPQTDYDGGIIEIRYPTEMYDPDGGQFAGAVDNTDGIVKFTNSYLGPNIIYNTGPSIPPSEIFTSIYDMLDSFNFSNTLLAQATVTGTSGPNYVVNIVVPTPPAWAYNGTTLKYEYISNRTYINIGTYSGGSDTTAATYTLVILDDSNDPFLTVIGTGNFSNYQGIVNSLNSQSTFNSDFIASLSVNNIIITTLYDPQGAFYNDYSFQLALDYTSMQYTANDFVSTVGIMSGGLDAVAPNITLVNEFIPLTILDLPQNSYDVDGISGFVDYFNGLSPYNYSAEYLGTSQDLPEILSQSLLNMPSLTGDIPNTVLKAFYAPSVISAPTLIGTFTPTTGGDYTPSGLALGLANAVNLNVWDGTATTNLSTLILSSPSGTFGSYNNYISAVTLKVPNAKAIVNVTFLTPSTGAGTVELTVSFGSVSLGIQSIPVAQTAVQWATAYKNRINSGTGTHGYTAFTSTSSPTISIYAPANTGTILNTATISAVTTGGVTIKTTPTPTFNGGTDTTTTVALNVFSGGGYTIYDKVRFTADPDIYTWEYTDDLINGNLTYTNLTASPNYINTGAFFGGIDNTAGQFSLVLTNTPPAFPALFYVLYNDSTPVIYDSFQEWVDAVNNSASNLDFSTSVLTTDFTVHSPEDSFAYFNNSELAIDYTYASPQWSGFNYSNTETIINGLDPVLTSYEGIFEAGVLGNFIKSNNPCTPTIATQTCLTNNQASKIIQHINKLTK